MEDRLEDFSFLGKYSSLYRSYNVRVMTMLEDMGDFCVKIFQYSFSESYSQIYIGSTTNFLCLEN